MPVTRFLKLVLTADALSCLGMGAGLVVAAAPLSPVFGLAEPLLLGAGLALLPIGLFILAVARRRTVMPLSIHSIIVGNVLWVGASLVLAAAAREATTLGIAFVLAQAAAVAVLTLLEARGTALVARAAAA